MEYCNKLSQIRNYNIYPKKFTLKNFPSKNFTIHEKFTLTIITK